MGQPGSLSANALTTNASALRVGIVTTSDRASRGEYEDLSGPAVVAFLGSALADGWVPVTRLVPDDEGAIHDALLELIEQAGCRLVITTGGTGVGPRDVTPEATRRVIERELPGFGERMRSVSAETVPTSILSRALAGTRGRALIVNLPGNPRAIDECLGAVFPAIPHCLSLLDGEPHETPG